MSASNRPASPKPASSSEQASVERLAESTMTGLSLISCVLSEMEHEAQHGQRIDAAMVAEWAKRIAWAVERLEADQRYAAPESG
jgi:hypothetical protein